MKSFDYIFIGFGASTALLLRSLQRYGRLEDKRVAIIDPDLSKGNDKTFCFWSEDTDPVFRDNKDLIDKSWSNIRVDNLDTEALAPLRYHHIESIRLYRRTKEMLKRYDITWIEAPVTDVTANKDLATIHWAHGKAQSNQVFDSRPAPFVRDEKHPFLWQSFIGYRVKVNRPVFDTEVYHKMDFQVPQNGATQFLYTLPFSESEALVELTRFGVDHIDLESSKQLLHEIVQERYGNFEILREEIGAIPMATGEPQIQKIKHINAIGTRANRVKPSTGYAFKRMYDDAESIAKNTRRETTKPRFAFYDHLLLWILAVKPHWGRVIFKTLFKKLPATFVLRFLDEESRFLSEIGMFLRLPLKPFLQSLAVYSRQRVDSFLSVWGVPLLSLVLWFLYVLNPSLALISSGLLLGIGFLSVGLPHGALDAHLERGNQSFGHFIIRYLSLMTSMLFLWWLSPLVALILFLAYSALHFGETDIVEWGVDTKIIGFLWGFSLLSVLLVGHWNETTTILMEWGIDLVDGTTSWITPFLLILFASSFVGAIYLRKGAWLASLVTLAIGLKLPLLVAFGLYFIGQHSVSGWNHLRKAQGWTHLGMYTRGLPYTVGALAVFALLWWVDNSFLTDQLGWLFIGLSVISFPHVIMFHGFYKQERP